MQRKFIVIMIMLFIMSGMSACDTKQKEALSLETTSPKETQENSSYNMDEIFVYICGAVQNEGVYEVPAGSRVYEVVQKAGGFTEEAATTYVNQAEIVRDEERIYIPTQNEALELQVLDDGKVNLNTATKEELMTIPGVGESKADSIVQYREEIGKFQTIEDIMNVSGIKEGLFQKIKDYIKI